MDLQKNLIPVFTDLESKALDQFTIENGYFTGTQLMGHAALSIFTQYKKIAKNSEVIILSGSGNNGGDGLALGYFFQADGHENVKIFLKSGNHTEEFSFYHDLCKRLGVGINNLEEFHNLDLYPENKVILFDCLCGTGFKPPMNGESQEICKQIERFKKSFQSKLTIVSVDASSFQEENQEGYTIPTDFLAEIGVQKIRNVHFRFKKKYSFHPIGFPLNIYLKNKPNGLFYQIQPLSRKKIKKILTKSQNSNKYSNGACCFIGGSTGMSGAIVLSSSIFQKMGGGILKIFTPSENSVIKVLKKDPSFLCSQLDLNTDLKKDSFFNKTTTIVIGSGYNTNEFNEAWTKSFLEKKIIADAGFIERSVALGRNSEVMITPHAGEYYKLTGFSGKTISEVRQHTSDYSRDKNIYILFKSYFWILATPEGNSYLYYSPNPRLAVMGTGDLLAGMLGFFVSRGYNFVTAFYLSASIFHLCKEMSRKNPSANEILNFIEKEIGL